MQSSQRRRLTRSDDRILGGVASGLADYLDLDPTLLRLGWVIAVVVGLPFAVVAYLILWLITPARSEAYFADVRPGPVDPAHGIHDRASRHGAALILGFGLMAAGLLFLMPDIHFLPWLGFGLLRLSWPVVLILIGVLLLVRSTRATR